MIRPSPALVAEVLLANFDKHFQTFQRISRSARERYIQADWAGSQRSSRERIKLYDMRVAETIEELRGRFAIRHPDPVLWQEIKQAYTQRLQQHAQSELAETFYNSVFCHMFHRRYFNNDQIFVESTGLARAIQPPVNMFKRWQLSEQGIARSFFRLLAGVGIGLPFADPLRDLRAVIRALRKQTGLSLAELSRCWIKVFNGVFYRNKAAYLVGKLRLGDRIWPLIIPVINEGSGHLHVDALICDQDQLAILFSFSRSSFMVTCQVPSALVGFLNQLLPTKSHADLYMAIGFHKQAKNEFYRGFLQQLAQSSDHLIIAPGVRGMVMSVFTLPSWPYVFKVIKDRFDPPKQMTRKQVKDKYQLVKMHDRVGRMADTLEFSDAAFPRERFSPELLEELRQCAGNSLQEEGDHIVIRHLYVERRMQPLNLYLEQADPQQRDLILDDYGKAIKQLAAANIFPGDMLLKNFGVTRHGRVIFYDYDEICYMTECNFRPKPKPQTWEQEMASEPWYTVMPGDVFPEEIFTFVTPRPADRETLLRLHPDLIDFKYWQQMQMKIQRGMFDDVVPYPQQLRFAHPNRYSSRSQANEPNTTVAAVT